MKNNPIIVFIIILLVGLTQNTDNLKANPLPDTGISQCHNQTQIMDCPQSGESYYGQDAQYTINPHQFIKYDANGSALPTSADQWSIVYDKATGLMWEVKSDDGSLFDRDRLVTWFSSRLEYEGTLAVGKYNNGENTEIYVQALNNNQLGGFSDWRIPTVLELRTILDFTGQNSHILTQFFPYTQAKEYWTIQSKNSDLSKAWCVHFNDGLESLQEKRDVFYVRAVRSARSQSSGAHLLINPDNTVTDVHTGLMWQREINISPQTWAYALDNCENHVEANFSDWRMPSILELQSIVDYETSYSPTVNTTIFPDTPKDLFWTSSPTQNPGIIYNVQFENGITHSSETHETHYYRAVRGGQTKSSENLVILSPSQADLYTIGSFLQISWEPDSFSGPVKIELSRQAGRLDSFEIITQETENDGQYEWKITPPASPNCLVKITPLQTSTRQNTVGLFSIIDTKAPLISGIAATSTIINQASHSIEYTINDTDGGSLMVIAESGNEELIPLENIRMGNTAPYNYVVIEYGQQSIPKYLTITPSTGQSGTTNITLTVYDSGFLSAKTSFQFTVGDMRSALVQLYKQTNGDGWIRRSGWKATPLYNDGFAMPQTECTWDGIACDSYGHVVRINLSGNLLSGKIPVELGNLDTLVQLHLNNNQLSGEIPANLSLLKNLQELRLDHNELTGTIPLALTTLPDLQVLQLNNNELSGELPLTIDQMQSLLNLNISQNQLSGSFPQAVLSLSQLQRLDMSYNKMSGMIPDGLSYLTYLQVISIAGNQFSGNLPSDIQSLSMLENNQSDFRYNMLTTQDSALDSFISLKQIDNENWKATQTVFPTNFKALDSTSNMINFNWTPISYIDHDGGYEVCCATYIGQNFDKCHNVMDKKLSSSELSGLSPEATYYCQIRSFTLPHADNPNQLFSEFSDPITAVTQEQEIIWNHMESTSHSWLNHVWGTSSTNVFVVGNESLILHYDGSNWSSMTRTTQNNLHNIFGLSDTDVVAVGADGTINHFDGTRWELQTPVVDTFLWGLWGVNDIMYAVGSYGTILKRENDTWQEISSSTDTHLRDIWGSDLNDIFIVGDQGTILHHNGSAWEAMESNTSVDLRCVYGFSGNDVYAAGYNGTILHYNGQSWTTMNSGVDIYIMDLWGVNANSVFAVGQGGTVLYNDSSGWQKMESGTLNYLRGIWGTATTDVFTVGYEGTILRLGASVPYISFIPPQETYINIEKEIEFTVQSTMTSPDKLGVKALSANPLLIPNNYENIKFQGQGSSRYLFIRPAHNQYGETDIVITVQSPNGLTATSQFHITIKNQVVIPTAERKALEALYNNTNGANWRNSEGWMGPLSTECNWYGVTCEDNTHVNKLLLPENELSGTLPEEIGNLTKLIELDLHGNTLTGVLPNHIGDVNTLDIIDLSHNELSGALPSEWGNIQGLLHLKLNNNSLSGNIPSSIRNIQFLQALMLESNHFSGNIPEEIQQLPFMLPNASDFRYNALYTDNEAVRNFVNNIQKDGDWESTQTTAPEKFDFTRIGAYAISLLWSLPQYTSDDGGYEIFYADQPNGLFRIVGPTLNKTKNSINITNLLPETTYYFKIRTNTAPHAQNSNTVYSDFSEITTASTKDAASIPLWENGSFETGDFYGWTVQDIPQAPLGLNVAQAGGITGSQWDQLFKIEPTDGIFAAVYAFSGSPGTIRMSQEIYIPAGGAALSFDYRMGWDMTFGYATLPRRFEIAILPENGDIPLKTIQIRQADPNTQMLDTGKISEEIDLAEFSCQTVRISFDLHFSESDISPSLFQLDKVQLKTLYSKVLDILLPDSVTEGDGLLEKAGKIQVPVAVSEDLLLHLLVSDDEIIIPDQIVIPKGQKQANFDIAVRDDNVINGRRSIAVSLDDPNWAACDTIMWISDNDDSWQKIHTGIQTHLFSIWGRSENDIFAAGEKGQILHYDGTSWQSMESGTQNNLNAIWGDDKQVFIVGDEGTLLSYDGNNWMPINISINTPLTSIWGAEGKIFTAGPYGILIEKTSTDWLRQSPVDSSDMPVKMGGNEHSIYMISQSGVHTYTAGDWIPILSSLSSTMNDINLNTDNHSILIGEKGSILYKTDTDWKSALSGTVMDLNAATSGDTVFYAVGNNGSILRSQTPDTWIKMNAQTTQHLHDVWAASKNNVFAVGDNGTVIRYSGPDIQGIQDAEYYIPGEILTIANMISFPSNVTSLTLCVNVPQEWIFNGTDAHARVLVDDNNRFTFSWTDQLLSPMIFNYRIKVPKRPADNIEITSNMIYGLKNGEIFEKNMLPSPLILEKSTKKYELSIILDPSDGGFVSGNGVMCPPVCSKLFDASENIQLNASPSNYYNFEKWIDSSNQEVLSKSSLNLTLTENKLFQVIFHKNEEPSPPVVKYPLNLEILDTYAVLFELMPFHDPENDDHLLTEWRVHRADRPHRCDGIFIDNCIQSESDYLTQYSRSNLISGMQYLWDVGHKDAGSEVLVRSNLKRFTIGQQVIDDHISIEAGLEQKDYQMVCLPLWLDNPSAPIALKDAVLTDYDTRYMKIGMFDPIKNQYIQYNPTMEILPGKAFWVLARKGMRIPVRGVRVSRSIDIDVPLSYSLDNQNGWNMIGSPNGANYYWNRLIVVPYNDSGEMIDENGTPIQASQLKTLAEWGPDNPFMDPRVWRWEKGAYQEGSAESSYVSESLIKAYKGYWVQAKQTNVWLRFPVKGQVSIKRTQSNRLTDQWAFSDESSSPPLPMEGLQADSDISKGCFISNIAFGVSGYWIQWVLFLGLLGIISAVFNGWGKHN
ncbi:protein containing DUF1566 [Candidatus Magnetomorum sp. HK-1]|nr:protein containing DUF1566 [Candidatus Magnetomorum sp. HK-1]